MSAQGAAVDPPTATAGDDKLLHPIDDIPGRKYGTEEEKRLLLHVYYAAFRPHPIITKDGYQRT